MQNLIIGFLGCLFFCQIDFPIESVPSTFIVEVYQSGKPIEQFNIDSTDELINFFEKEKNGWKKDNTTYAPNYLLFSENMKINILTKKIVINYQNEKGKWGQYSKEINGEELISMINQSRK